MAKQTVIKIQDFGKTVKITAIRNVLSIYAVEEELGKDNAFKYVNKRFSYIGVNGRIAIKGNNGEQIGIGVGKVLDKAKFEELLDVMRKAGQRYSEFKRNVHKSFKI